MELGDIELHPEVRAWLESLSDEQYGHVREYVRLLAEHGPTLGESYTRQLRGKLRELRFHLERGQWRIMYWIMPGLRIALLTVFRKQRQRERAEIGRAWRAMQRCIAEGHTAEED